MSTDTRFAYTTVPLWFAIDSNNQVDEFLRTFYASATVLLNITFSETNLFSTESFMDYGGVIGPDNATGIVGLLQRNEADISLYPIPPTYKAFKYIDYSHSIYRAVWKVMTIKPMKSTSHSFALLRTFSWQIWLCVFLSIHSIYLLSYVQAWKIHFKFRCLKEYVGILAILLLQGYNPKRGLVTDIAWTCWFIPLYFVTIFFSGIFLSELTLPETLHYYDSLQDLLQNPRLKIELPKSSSVHYHLADSTAETDKEIYKQILKTNGLFDPMELDLDSILSNMHNGNEVMIMEKSTVHFAFVSFLDCESQKYELHFSKKNILVENFAFMFRRGYVSTLIPKFKKFVLRYMESNLVEKEINNVINEKPSCAMLFQKKEKSHDVLPLNMENMKFPLYLVLAGYFVSILVLFCQVLQPPKIQKRSNKRRVKQNYYSKYLTAAYSFRAA